MALPLIMAGVAAAGSALQIYGNFKAAKQKAAFMRQKAMIGNMRATEVLARNEINNDILFKNAKTFTGRQLAQLAGTGGGLSASAMAQLEETFDIATEQAVNNSRVANWEARMLRMGADSDMVAASGIDKAAPINALAQGMGAAASTFMMSKQVSGQTPQSSALS